MESRSALNWAEHQRAACEAAGAHVLLAPPAVLRQLGTKTTFSAYSDTLQNRSPPCYQTPDLLSPAVSPHRHPEPFCSQPAALAPPQVRNFPDLAPAVPDAARAVRCQDSSRDGDGRGVSMILSGADLDAWRTSVGWRDDRRSLSSCFRSPSPVARSTAWAWCAARASSCSSLSSPSPSPSPSQTRCALTRGCQVCCEGRIAVDVVLSATREQAALVYGSIYAYARVPRCAAAGGGDLRRASSAQPT